MLEGARETEGRKIGYREPVRFGERVQSWWRFTNILGSRECQIR
jgi:hypothetical protein